MLDAKLVEIGLTLFRLRRLLLMNRSHLRWHDTMQSHTRCFASNVYKVQSR